MAEIDVSKYTRIPFKDLGRGYDGCDCYGLVYLIYRDALGIELPSLTYEDTVDRVQLEKVYIEAEHHWQKVDEPEPYDVVGLRRGRHPSHCGVYIGDGRFVHTIDGPGVIIERIDTATERNRIIGYYRHRQ